MWHAVGMKKGRDLDVEGILTADLGFERFWKREMGELLGLPKGSVPEPIWDLSRSARDKVEEEGLFRVWGSFPDGVDGC